VRMSFSVGSRVSLLGPNGCGKTSLLKTLEGTLKLLDGRRTVGVGGLRRARVRLFTQDLAQDLPMDQTPVEYLLSGDAPGTLDAQRARGALGALGLRGEVHNSKIGSLSGGEKARVALAVFTTRPADVLLLDEPTNHLDVAAVAALSEGLREHAQGAVIVASHDSAFVQDLQVTMTATVERGTNGNPGTVKVVTIPTNFEEQVGVSVGTSSTSVSSSTVTESKPAGLSNNALRKAERGARQRAERLMKNIEKAEVELEEAEQKMNASYSDETLAAYEKANARVEKLYADLETAEMALA